MRTYEDIQKLETALRWLGNQQPGPNVKASAYNALNLRLLLCIEAYTPVFNAVTKAQRAVFDKYVVEAADAMKELGGGQVTFGAELDRRYKAEIADLFQHEVEDEPRRRPFTLSEFDSVGIAVPQVILEQMGNMFEKPRMSDPDDLTNFSQDQL